MSVCGDPKVLKAFDPLDNNPLIPLCSTIHRWVGVNCSTTFLCEVSQPGKADDYFTSTCIQDKPTKAHCAKSCEEMGLVTAK